MPFRSRDRRRRFEDPFRVVIWLICLYDFDGTCDNIKLKKNSFIWRYNYRTDDSTLLTQNNAVSMLQYNLLNDAYNIWEDQGMCDVTRWCSARLVSVNSGLLKCTSFVHKIMITGGSDSWNECDWTHTRKYSLHAARWIIITFGFPLYRFFQMMGIWSYENVTFEFCFTESKRYSKWNNVSNNTMQSKDNVTPMSWSIVMRVSNSSWKILNIKR